MSSRLEWPTQPFIEWTRADLETYIWNALRLAPAPIDKPHAELARIAADLLMADRLAS